LSSIPCPEKKTKEEEKKEGRTEGKKPWWCMPIIPAM
jgi:hypothetical protein